MRYGLFCHLSSVTCRLNTPWNYKATKRGHLTASWPLQICLGEPFKVAPYQVLPVTFYSRNKFQLSPFSLVPDLNSPHSVSSLLWALSVKVMSNLTCFPSSYFPHSLFSRFVCIRMLDRLLILIFVNLFIYWWEFLYSHFFHSTQQC